MRVAHLGAVRTLLVAMAAIVSACVACTSSGGALPETSAPLAPPAPAGIANRALLNAAALPHGFRDQRTDVGDRWGEIIDESRDAVSLRPDCQAPLSAASAQLHEQARQTAGATFSDGSDTDIRQFVAVLPSGVGPALVGEVRAAYSRCDSFSVTEPEWGSIDLTIEVIAPRGVTVPPGAQIVVWKRTLLSSVITRVEYRAFYAYRTVAGAIAFDGHARPDEVSTVMAGAIRQAQRATS